MKSGVLADGCNDIDIYILGSLQYAVYMTSETRIMHTGLQKARRYPSLVYHTLIFIREISYIKTELVQSCMGQLPSSLSQSESGLKLLVNRKFAGSRILADACTLPRTFVVQLSDGHSHKPVLFIFLHLYLSSHLRNHALS